MPISSISHQAPIDWGQFEEASTGLKPLFDPQTAEARIRALQSRSLDLFHSLASSSLGETQQLDLQRTQLEKEKRAADQEVEEAHEALEQWNRTSKHIDVASTGLSTGLALASGGVVPTIAAGLNVFRLLSEGSGAYERSAHALGDKSWAGYLRGAMRLVGGGATIAAALTSGPAAAADKLQKFLQGGVAAATSFRGLSAWKQGNVRLVRTEAENATLRIRTMREDLNMEHEELWAILDGLNTADQNRTTTFSQWEENQNRRMEW